MAANNQDNDFFFDPEHDEAEDASAPESLAFSGQNPAFLLKQKDYLERLLGAWQTAHGDKKKKKAA